MFLDISTPKFSAQAIKKMAETKWDALHLLSDAAGSIASTLVPAGLENSKGVITVAFRKDPNDPAWTDDPGMKEYLAFMKQYMPDANPSETYHVFGYATAQTFVHVLEELRRRPDPREPDEAGDQHQGPATADHAARASRSTPAPTHLRR